MKNQLLLLLLLGTLQLSAQNIDGFYKGVLHNDSAKMIQQYELAIAMYKGKVSGYSYVTFIVNDTFYYGIRKVKGEIVGDSLVIHDDKFVSNNFPESPAKGVKRTITIPINRKDSTLDHLAGSWKTNQTKKYYSVPGKIEMARSDDSLSSPLINHLKELRIVPTDYQHVAYADPAHVPSKDDIKKNKEDEQKIAAAIEKQKKKEKEDALKMAADIEKQKKKEEADKLKIAAAIEKQKQKEKDDDQKTAAANEKQKQKEKEDELKTAAALEKQKQKERDEEMKRMAKLEAEKKKKMEDDIKTAARLEEVKKENTRATDLAAQKKKAEQQIEKDDLLRKETVPVPIKKELVKMPWDQRKTGPTQDIVVQSDSIVLSFYDNGVVDGDSISVYLNGEVLVSNAKLTTAATKKPVSVKDMDELKFLLVAENMGSIPPNTGLLTIRDGDNIYQVNFTADMQTNASIIIRRKKQ